LSSFFSVSVVTFFATLVAGWAVLAPCQQHLSKMQQLKQKNHMIINKKNVCKVESTVSFLGRFIHYKPGRI
jgi:hypothetical protein